MKTKSVLKLFFLAVILIFAVSSVFAGQWNKKATKFEATVVVYQIDSGNRLSFGRSNFYRTTGEVLVGQVVDSDWADFLGAGVSMQNVTNFRLGAPRADGTYPLTGTNHSDIEISMLNGEELTINANGWIKGTYPAAADVTMNFNSVGNGSTTRIHGILTGSFVWYVAYLDPPQAPYGYFTLTGYYR